MSEEKRREHAAKVAEIWKTPGYRERVAKAISDSCARKRQNKLIAAQMKEAEKRAREYNKQHYHIAGSDVCVWED